MKERYTQCSNLPILRRTLESQGNFLVLTTKIVAITKIWGNKFLLRRTFTSIIILFSKYRWQNLHSNLSPNLPNASHWNEERDKIRRIKKITTKNWLFWAKFMYLSQKSWRLRSKINWRTKCLVAQNLSKSLLHWGIDNMWAVQLTQITLHFEIYL